MQRILTFLRRLPCYLTGCRLCAATPLGQSLFRQTCTRCGAVRTVSITFAGYSRAGEPLYRWRVLTNDGASAHEDA